MQLKDIVKINEPATPHDDDDEDDEEEEDEVVTRIAATFSPPTAAAIATIGASANFEFFNALESFRFALSIRSSLSCSGIRSILFNTMIILSAVISPLLRGWY